MPYRGVFLYPPVCVCKRRANGRVSFDPRHAGDRLANLVGLAGCCRSHGTASRVTPRSSLVGERVVANFKPTIPTRAELAEHQREGWTPPFLPRPATRTGPNPFRVFGWLVNLEDLDPRMITMKRWWWMWLEGPKRCPIVDALGGADN